MNNEIAAIGMKRSKDASEAKERFANVMKSVEQFVGDHPEMLTGEGEFSVVFGTREKIMALGVDPGRPVPLHGSGPGSPTWQPPKI